MNPRGPAICRGPSRHALRWVRVDLRPASVGYTRGWIGGHLREYLDGWNGAVPRQIRHPMGRRFLSGHKDRTLTQFQQEATSDGGSKPGILARPLSRLFRECRNGTWPAHRSSVGRGCLARNDPRTSSSTIRPSSRPPEFDRRRRETVCPESPRGRIATGQSFRAPQKTNGRPTL